MKEFKANAGGELELALGNVNTSVEFDLKSFNFNILMAQHIVRVLSPRHRP